MNGWQTVALIVGVSLGLGCGGGASTDTPPPPPPTYTIGGTVSGLVLVRDGTTELAIPAGATSFTFTGSVGGGSPYSRHPQDPADRPV